MEYLSTVILRYHFLSSPPPKLRMKNVTFAHRPPSHMIDSGLLRFRLQSCTEGAANGEVMTGFEKTGHLSRVLQCSVALEKHTPNLPKICLP